MTKLLIVEDDELLDKAYIQKFTEFFELKIAENVEQAIEQMTSFRPNVILLDLYMPGKLNGIDFLKIIKKDENYNNIPVVVITNLPDSVDKVMNMGAVSCFMKSNASLEKIVEEINRVVNMVK